MFDATIIAFCAGCILIILIGLFYLIFGIESKNSSDWLTEMGSGILIYYFTAILIYFVFATGLAI